jgi:DNA-directed RNA polymerase specialized sigma24 family protein
MKDEGSVTHWIRQLKEVDDPDAQREIWNRYFERLLALAREKLRNAPSRGEDEEDVVLSAMNTFFRGARIGRYPNLHDRSNLWALLVTITARKAINRVTRQRTLKRGGGQKRYPSALHDPAVLEEVVGREPTPEFAVRVAEECQRRLDCLDESVLRQIAELKLQESTNGEIARELGVSKRTVERKLRRIRALWSDEGAT